MGSDQKAIISFLGVYASVPDHLKKKKVTKVEAEGVDESDEDVAHEDDDVEVEDEHMMERDPSDSEFLVCGGGVEGAEGSMPSPPVAKKRRLRKKAARRVMEEIPPVAETEEARN